MNTFDTKSYKARLQEFPDISYQEYQQITDLQVRRDIAKKNKIIQTDAYNRTMNFLKWEKSYKRETFSLSFRRSPNKQYVVVDGIRSTLKDILWVKISQWELDFAKAFYADQKARWWNGYFDEKMRQYVVDNGGFLPLDIKAVDDGTVLKPKEPAMLVSWPAELAAVYEPVFLRAFFKSIVATDAHYLEEIIWQWRVAEFGKRAAPNEDFHLDAVEANIVGGALRNTSNDTAALVYPQVLSGWTTAHRYFACYPTENDAFINAIETCDKIALLVDLVDSYQWIDKIVELKKKYRASWKIIWMRLDSWDLADQAVYALNKLKENWMLDPKLDKIVVADISTVDDVRRVEEAVTAAWFDPKDFIQYWLGWLLVARNKTRDALSAGYKLINTEDWATGKLSNDIDKEPIPGDTNIELRDGVRYIVQEDEEVMWERLLKNVYSNGELKYDDNDLQAVDDARNQLLRTFEMSKWEMKESNKTREIHEQVRDNLMNNLDDYISMKKLYALWTEVFGDKDKFELRLDTPNFFMEWKTPKSISQTQEWKIIVYEELIRINEGILC